MSLSKEIKMQELVNVSNEFCRLPWKWEDKIKSVWVLRLFAVIASKVKSTDKNFTHYQVSVDELMRKCEAYSEKKSAKAERMIQDLFIDSCGELLNMKVEEWMNEKWVGKPVFSLVEYYFKDKYVNVELHEGLKPYFLNLKSRFTSYSLDEFLKLSSIYSQKLYCFLLSWASAGETVHTVPYLYRLLGWMPKDKVFNFAEFERTVLAAAKKEIEEKTGLRFEYKAVKDGRSVTKVAFTVSAKTQVYSQELLPIEQHKKPIFAPNEEKLQEQIENNKLYLDLVRFLPANTSKEESLNPKALLSRRIFVDNWKEGLTVRQIKETERIYNYAKKERAKAVA